MDGPDTDFGYVCTVTLTLEIWPWFKIMTHPWVMDNNKYRIWNELPFHTVFRKLVVCFYIPEPLVKWTMKWKLISDSFYHMLKLRKRKKTQFYGVFLLILLRKTCQHRGITYDIIDKLRHLSLSKSFPALCHKFIYETVIFHSLDRETCDNVKYYPEPTWTPDTDFGYVCTVILTLEIWPWTKVMTHPWVMDSHCVKYYLDWTRTLVQGYDTPLGHGQ